MEWLGGAASWSLRMVGAMALSLIFWGGFVVMVEVGAEVLKFKHENINRSVDAAAVIGAVVALVFLGWVAL